MPRKRLDQGTLEVIAETICGAGQGSGGGASYAAPGPYRSMSKIHAFFDRADVEPQGQSSTRKWFVLESLDVLNCDQQGDLLPASLAQVLLRLGDPREYRGDAETTRAVISHLNSTLKVEGLEIVLYRITPRIQETTPGLAPPKPQQPARVPAPNFQILVTDSLLAEIIAFRWDEAQRCVEGGAFLSAVVMMGSVLEGVLLAKAEADRTEVCRASRAPKDKTGKVRPLRDWNLNALIDVAHEMRWLGGDVKRFSHALRESRNIIHPYVERAVSERPDSDTCRICWPVVRAAVADLLGGDSDQEGGAQSL